MYLLDKVQPLEDPGVCFICQETPDRKTVNVIHTGRIFDPGILRTDLNGIKYLCETCVDTARIQLGWPSQKEALAWKEAAEHLDQEVNDLMAKLNRYRTLEDTLRDAYEHLDIVRDDEDDELDEWDEDEDEGSFA